MYSKTKWLTVLDGELRHHRARPEYITMHCYVMAEDLGKNPPGLQPPIQHLVIRSHPPPHPPIRHSIGVIPGALNLVGVAAVALVDLNPLARLMEVPQNLGKDFNICELTCRVRSVNLDKIPNKDVDDQLVAEGGLPRILVGCNGVPLLCNSLLQDSEVGTINCCVLCYLLGAQ